MYGLFFLILEKSPPATSLPKHCRDCHKVLRSKGWGWGWGWGWWEVVSREQAGPRLPSSSISIAAATSSAALTQVPQEHL